MLANKYKSVPSFSLSNVFTDNLVGLWQGSELIRHALHSSSRSSRKDGYRAVSSVEATGCGEAVRLFACRAHWDGMVWEIIFS